MEYQKRMQQGETLLKIVAALLLLSCFVSCRTSEQLLNKALDKDRGFVIGKLREIAPCVTTKDTVLSTEYKTNTDTITETKTVEVEVDCPPNTSGVKVVKSVSYDNTTYLRTDSIFIVKQTTVRDMADSIHYSGIIVKQDREIKKQSKKKNFWFIWSVIVTLMLVITLVGKYLLRMLPWK